MDVRKRKLLSIFRGYIGDNGKEHGNYYKYIGCYIGDDGKENGNYYILGYIASCWMWLGNGFAGLYYRDVRVPLKGIWGFYRDMIRICRVWGLAVPKIMRYQFGGPQ